MIGQHRTSGVDELAEKEEKEASAKVGETHKEKRLVLALQVAKKIRHKIAAAGVAGGATAAALVSGIAATAATQPVPSKHEPAAAKAERDWAPPRPRNKV